MTDWSTYQAGYDHARRLFTKKQSAASLADFLAAELQLNRKSFVVEGKGHEFHLFNGYIDQYWMPTAADRWDDEMTIFQRMTKGAMQ